MAPAPSSDAAPWIAGSARTVSDWITLHNPYDGSVAARVARSSDQVVHEAVSAATSAQAEVAAMPVHARAAVLRRAADLVETHPEDYAARVTRQTGKALKNLSA